MDDAEWEKLRRADLQDRIVGALYLVCAIAFTILVPVGLWRKGLDPVTMLCAVLAAFCWKMWKWRPALVRIEDDADPDH